jgi:hypothetical protein
MFQYLFNFSAKYEPPAVIVVVKLAYTQRVARTKQLLPGSIPDCESEIPHNAAHTLISPGQVRLENEFRVCGVCPDRNEGTHFCHQVFAVVHASIAGDHIIAVIGTQGLLFPLGLGGGAELQVGHPHILCHQVFDPVRPTIGHDIRHRFEHTGVNRAAIRVIYSSYATQISLSGPPLIDLLIA